MVDAGEALIRSLAMALLTMHERLVANGYLEPGEVSEALRRWPVEPDKPLLSALVEGLAVDLDALPVGAEKPRTAFSVITGGRQDGDPPDY